MSLSAARPAGPDEMGRELAEGPDAVERTLASLAPLRASVDRLLYGAERVMFLGTGASLAVVRAAAPSWQRQRSVIVRQSTEGVFADADGYRFEASTLVIAVSQSGASPETLAAMRIARTRGCEAIAITARPGSALAAAASLTVPVASGDERGAATKSALATLAALLGMAGELDDASGRAVATALSDTVSSWRSIAAASPALAVARHTWFLGFGSALGIAEAGALLWHEKVIRPAIGTTPSEFRHGLIEAAGPRDVVVLIDVDAPDPRRLAYLGRLHEELAELEVAMIEICAGPAVPPTPSRIRYPIDGETTAIGALTALLRVQQLARATALTAGTYRDEFAVLRRVVHPATDLLE
jgi:glucosamine--fructose-6-phosphate aminotransferase (isomerizing)